MKFNINTGVVDSGDDYPVPEALAKVATMSQLVKLGSYIGVKVDRTQSKLGAAKKLFIKAEFLYGARPTPVEKKERRKAFVKPAPEPIKFGRSSKQGPNTIITIDADKWLRLRPFNSRALTRYLDIILEGAKGPVKITRASFEALNLESPRGGHVWKNFLWYKARGYLKPVLVQQ